MALLDDEPRKATVSAYQGDCECFVLDRETFTRLLGSLQHIIDREATQRLEVLKGAGPSDNESSSQLNLSLSDLAHVAVLGSGTFGRVTLVQDKASKQVYALKAMLKSEIVAHKQQLNVLNEKNVMITSNHTFILRLYQTFKDARKLYMLLEFVQGESSTRPHLLSMFFTIFFQAASCFPSCTRTPRMVCRTTRPSSTRARSSSPSAICTARTSRTET